jgi:hypothetical protein
MKAQCECIYNQRGALIYTALIIMVIIFILAVVVSEVVSMLRYERKERIREEQILLQLDNTIQEGISYVQSIPFEDIRRAKGLHDDLMKAEYPAEWVMVSERCGFVASLLSLSGDEVVWEIWGRCRYRDVDKIEKVKVRMSLQQL